MAHASFANSTPRITATTSISRVCSFASDDPPEIQITLTLQTECAITIATRNEPFWPIQNALVISNADTKTSITLPRVDVNYRTAPPLALAQAHDAAFITLVPGVPYNIVQNFRPFGHEIFDAVKVASMGGARYQLAGAFGMHQFVPGQEYLLVVEKDLRITNWKYGTKAELLTADLNDANAMQSDGDPIVVYAEGQVNFRVQE